MKCGSMNFQEVSVMVSELYRQNNLILPGSSFIFRKDLHF